MIVGHNRRYLPRPVTRLSTKSLRICLELPPLDNRRLLSFLGPFHSVQRRSVIGFGEQRKAAQAQSALDGLVLHSRRSAPVSPSRWLFAPRRRTERLGRAGNPVAGRPLLD